MVDRAAVIDRAAEAEFDVVVIGGGPAGASTAGLLARSGHRVAVLERERFPRYHVGESLITGMLDIIEELGLTERLDRMGFERKYGLSLIWGKERGLWDIKFAEGGPYEYSYHVRRDEFDELLLTRAAELGATVEFEATVKGPVEADGEVTGVEYTTPDGGRHVVGARFVVDASGQSRTVARHYAEQRWHEDLKNLAVWNYFTNCGRLPDDQRGNILVERVSDHDGWFWAIPLGEDRLSVGYVSPTGQLRDTSLTPDELFTDRMRHTERLAELLSDAEPVSRFRTARDWSYVAERLHGPGWVSVGDASGFIDPLLSTGVCLGILSASPLAQALDTALRDSERTESALRWYENGIREFLLGMTEYVRFFYDGQRDREDYMQRAAKMADPDTFVSDRSGFAAVIAGTTGLAPAFENATPADL
ncbi:Dehydrogenase (flavoprotein) [Actinopolyspora alba]|uniref:Dehydrogenase (Flavoprotein) n=1 Tax=Actinopolyspora alba TaxID=673379 RepID=A0A1I2C573_9ACTN|nr:NAD(P)/FAD-dependent oxidoreductase [Actinopolyspora alba]SFE63521.1 Dehydrogenase (flavoprotein) [Actinopolyspora alba]